MARFLAVAISQAPGLSGMPVSGQRSRATTSASWASSSASPTSRTIRASPAITRADSILQTALTARWTSMAGLASGGHPGGDSRGERLGLLEERLVPAASEDVHGGARQPPGDAVPHPRRD